MANRKQQTHRTSDRGTIEFSRQLRKNKTETEQLLWERLRRKALLGFRFRQQHPIGPYIADFFCNELGLVIELDGKAHGTYEQRNKDRMRDDAMKKHGLTVLRFKNQEIQTNLDQVIEKIEKTLRSLI